MSYSPRNRSAEIIVAIIGAAAVIAAAIIQLGKPLVERRITGAQSPLAMALKNYNCEPADYYVDGERVCSGLPAGGTAAFKTTTGEHWIYHCLAGTNDCSAASQVTWSVPGPLVIEADAKCTVAVRVENNDCTPTEYYVDDALMIPAVGAGQTGSFQVLRGEHRLKVCNEGGTACGGETSQTWNDAVILTTPPGPSCQVTITVQNNDCRPIEYYVDDALMIPAVGAGQTGSFQVLRGEHRLKPCYQGGTACGGETSQTWNDAVILTTPPGPYCHVTITVQNNDCQPIEYYVDDALMIPAVGTGQTGSFQVPRGEHRLKVCFQGGTGCSESGQTWNDSTTLTSPLGPYCK